MRVSSALSLLCLAACLSLGCHLISGVGDLEFVDRTSGTGAAGTGGLGPTTSSSAGGSAGAAASGGQGGVGAAAACLVGPQDPFDGAVVNAAVWNAWVQAATTGVAAGRFFVQPTAGTAPSWGEVTSVGSYDLTGCAVVVELVKALNNGGDLVTTFHVSSGSAQDSLGFDVTGGSIRGRVTVAGVETLLATTGYAAAQHEWLRVREEAGTVYLETSGNGKNWAAFGQTAAPSYLNLAYINFGGGSVSNTTVNPGEAQFDNVNLPP
jgi:hypothetical protein